MKPLLLISTPMSFLLQRSGVKLCFFKLSVLRVKKTTQTTGAILSSAELSLPRSEVPEALPTSERCLLADT